MTVVKSEKGKKRVCQNCTCRWYDLNKKPIVCPVCKEELEIENLNSILYTNNINITQDRKKNNNKNNNNEELSEINIEEDSNNISENEDIISLDEVENESN